MTTGLQPDSDGSVAGFGWSNRILLLAVGGILFSTLYPFHFDFHRHIARPLFPFSLGGWGKNVGRLDDFLNVLLFVPFGFGLAEKLREHGKSRLEALALALAAGTLLSYDIELFQIYIPQRDSGWEDVLTNSVGTFVGGALFELCGQQTLRLLSATEHRFCAWLTWRRTALILVLYMGFWCAIAAHLQKESRLANWSSDSVLTIGNSASVHPPPAWKGKVVALEIWDHAVPPKSARALASSDTDDSAASGSIVAYDFSGSAPFRDQRSFLPDLAWTATALESTGVSGAFVGGNIWLTSSGQVPLLVDDLEKTGQFSLRVRCRPAELSSLDARIVSISSPSSGSGLELRQDGTNLIVWIRTPLTLQRVRMSWVIPATFLADQMSDIMVTYDGADLEVFVDGIKRQGRYELGPGTVLASYFRRIKTPELEGYRYIFYGLVFLPIGCLAGLAWRRITINWIGRVVLFAFITVFFATLFEADLIYVSGRAMAIEDVVLSVLLVAGGGLWINADAASHTRAESSIA